MSEAYFDTSVPVPRGKPVSPGAILDFHEDWSAWLGEDPVLSVVWSAPGGLTVVDSSEADGVATVWLSGFVVDFNYKISCTITTDTSPTRRDTRYFLLPCSEH